MMKNKWLKVSLLTATLLGGLTYAATLPQSPQHVHADPGVNKTQQTQQTAQSPVWQVDEAIPFANKHMTIEMTNPDGKTVIDYKTGPNGEWRSEILASPYASEVGIIEIWDTQSFMTYYPDSSILSVHHNFVKNEKVFPNQLLGTVPVERAKKNGKIEKSDNKVDILTEERDVPLLPDSAVATLPEGDLSQQKTKKVKAKYHIDKQKNQLSKVETYEGDSLVAAVEIILEEEYAPNMIDFTFDRGKAKTILE